MSSKALFPISFFLKYPFCAICYFYMDFGCGMLRPLLYLLDMLLPCLQNTRDAHWGRNLIWQSKLAEKVMMSFSFRAVGQNSCVPLRMVGDDEDEGALSDSDGNTVLPGDDLAKK